MDMDYVLNSILVLTILLHCNVVQTEEQSDSSADSLRRYLNRFEQQRRLDRLKAAYYPESEGPRFAADSQAPYVGQNTGWPQDGVQRDSLPSRVLWRGKGQPEVFGDDTPIDKIQAFPQGADLQPLVNTGEPWSPEDGTTLDTTQTQRKKSEQEQPDDPRTGPPFAAQRQDVQLVKGNPFADVYFVIIVAGCSAAAIFGVIAAGYCFYRFQKNSKAAAEVDYPAYGVTGPNKDQTSPNGDRRLAQSAQMYHYQHQKQQMIAVEKATTARNTSASDIDSEEENEEGDYTVYECPGLAPTGEMEVKNPLFQDDSTPMSPPVVAKEIKKP